MSRTVEVGRVYRHFKGALYSTLAIAHHTENQEVLVIYKRLGEDKTYARPIEMFLSLVDKEKYPDSPQEYRFELWNKKITKGGK